VKSAKGVNFRDFAQKGGQHCDMFANYATMSIFEITRTSSCFRHNKYSMSCIVMVLG